MKIKYERMKSDGLLINQAVLSKAEADEIGNRLELTANGEDYWFELQPGAHLDVELSGDASGSLMIDGEGDGDATRIGEGYGDVARYGDGAGNAIRRSNNSHRGEAIRSAEGYGFAWEE